MGDIKPFEWQKDKIAATQVLISVEISNTCDNYYRTNVKRRGPHCTIVHKYSSNDIINASQKGGMLEELHTSGGTSGFLTLLSSPIAVTVVLNGGSSGGGGAR